MSGVFVPSNKEEALKSALEHILQAASDLCLASDLADEEESVAQYVCAADRLRDMANHLIPDHHDWPTGDGTCEIYDIRTGRKRAN